MLLFLVAGVIVGGLAAAAMNYAYRRLQNKPRAQLLAFMLSLFVSLALGAVIALGDMISSHAVWYWQADLSNCVAYYLGWMSVTFFGFALPKLR